VDVAETLAGRSSRRAFLAGSGAATGALAAGCAAVPSAPAVASWNPADPVLHVARRSAFGLTPSLLDEIVRHGPIGWIEHQLTSDPSWDAALDTQLASTLPYSRGSRPQLIERGDPWRVAYDLPAATLMRMVSARRQLVEHLVAFLWDVLSVDVNVPEVMIHAPDYDLVLRRFVTARYSDLLLASARSGAMLHYLDQASSRADGGRVPNENYARELLELHTVGVNGGYTEDDVTAVAHLLSGWGWDGAANAFVFRPTRHSLGPFTDPGRTVLGWSRGALTGADAGTAFLRHLARHPSTARRLAHRCCVRFIGDHITPGHPVVSAAAQAYLAADTALLPMYRTIFASADFWGSSGRRIRRPVEFLAAALRATCDGDWPDRSQPWTTTWTAFLALANLAQVPHHWPAPNGYPDVDARWVGSGPLVGRWNLATSTGFGGFPGFSLDEARLRGWAPSTTVGGWIDIAARRLGVPLTPEDRERICFLVLRRATDVLKPQGERPVYNHVLMLLMQSAAFQVR
jgi:hypothetical protein